MTLLGALVVLLHLRRRNLDFLHTYIHTTLLEKNQNISIVPDGCQRRYLYWIKL